MVDTPSALEALVARARTAEAVALDTEFVWERTYYPQLGLIQLGLGGDDVHLIDTVALDDLSPLGALLSDPAPVKVLHDAVQDLTLLRRVTGADPVNVFDTQRAAGFVGLTATISLQELFERTVDVSLPKGATRSNWVKRPLSQEQIQYAEDDVRYLLEARTAILERAHTLGRQSWIEEEMQRYDEPTQYQDGDPYEQGSRVRARGINRLSGVQRSILRELAAWRELEARRSDRPRRRVLEDELLVAVAQRQPRSRGDLSIKGFTDHQRQRFGSGLLEAVERGIAATPQDRPPRRHQHPEEDRIVAVTSILQAVLAGRSAREEVDPVLVATKSDLRALVDEGVDASPGEHRLLQGWRYQFMGEALLAVLAGKRLLRLDGPSGWPRLAEG